MALPGRMKWAAGPAWSVTLRYGLAAVSVAAALGLADALMHFHAPQTFGVFALCAIAITFWYAGTKPGILAALLSSVVRDLLFDPATSTESRLLFDLVFLIFALLMTQVVRGRYQLELEVAERTAELTRSNDNLKIEIAEHNRIETELRLSEAYLAEAQRLSHTGSWAWNPQSGEIRYWSEECYRVQGFDSKDGQPRFEEFFQRIHPDDQARIADVLERAIRKQEDFKFHYRIVHPSGEIRDAQSVGHPVLDRSGDLVEYVGTIIDVTESKQAEYLIAQVFECSPDAVLIIGADYRYKRVNPIHARNWGRPAESMVGMHMAELVGVEFFEQKLRPFLDRCFAGENVRFEDWFDNARGHRFISASYSPLRSGSQQVEAALVIARDLTEHAHASEALRQAQADLAHASRMTTMGELTASLAHEVNQPITAAVNGASTCVRWLTRDEPDLAEAREAATGAIRNAKRAADIINRIRSILKKGESKRQLADVNELIREMIALLRSETNRYSIPVRAELDADLPKVMADPVQVQQVVMNLIMNGIDAMKDVDQTRELAIRSRLAEDRQLMISISDTGVGLPAATEGQDIRCILYNQASRHRHGSSHQPVHRRIPWRPLMGSRQLAARRYLLLHPARSSRGAGRSRKAIGCSYQRMIAPAFSRAHSFCYELS